MIKKEIEDIQRRIDNILDIYFDELVDCFERKKDIQGLRGWLRINLHETVTKMHPVKESAGNKYLFHGVMALLVISILNLILIFFRYIVDPV